jgi:hypothetical protein
MTAFTPIAAVPRTSFPLHSDIAARARNLWIEYGCPGGCDDAIWLDAERRLIASWEDADSVRFEEAVVQAQQVPTRLPARASVIPPESTVLCGH